MHTLHHNVGDYSPQRITSYVYFKVQGEGREKKEDSKQKINEGVGEEDRGENSKEDVGEREL